MAKSYTREFLVEVFVSRFPFKSYKEQEEFTQKMGYDFYDKCVAELGATNGKKKFREYTCVDAEAIRNYNDTY